MLTTPRIAAVRIPQERVTTLAALSTTIGHAAEGTVTPRVARRARHDLRHRTIALLQTYDASVGATPRHRDVAERMWPAVVAAQRLAYRVLSTCRLLENAGANVAPEVARTLFGPSGESKVKRALTTVSAAIRARTKPAPLSQLPGFLNTEMRNLHDSLVCVRN